MLGEMQIMPDGTVLNKVDLAIRRLKSFEPEEGYYCAFSGGKDSQCIYHLCKLGGVKFDAHYNVTSVDPPELVRFIRKNYPDVSFDIPHDKDGKPITMWSLIAKHTLPPTRKVRYCCADLKEPGGKGRIVVTGVRWAESARRKATHGVVGFQGKKKGTIKKAEQLGADYKLNKHGNVIMNDDNDENRKMVESCYRSRKTMVNPIVDWSDEEVWEFLNDWVKVEHCCLYDEGFKRLGCIGCPLSGSKNMLRDFERWPKYKELYIKAFQRMIDNHPDQIKILRPEYRDKQQELHDQLSTEDKSALEIGGVRDLPPVGGSRSNLIPPAEKQESRGLVPMVDNSRSCSTGGYTTVTDDKLAEAIFRHWFVLVDGNGDSIIFTLNEGETWEDKQTDIQATIHQRTNTTLTPIDRESLEI